jgi:hypothetical protein
MPLHFRTVRKRMMSVSAWAASLLVAHTIIGLPRVATAQGVPNVPAPDEILENFTKKAAATRLLAEMGAKTPINTKVDRLIDRLVLRDRNQVQAAVTALTMLGQPAVPAIIRRLDDQRDMPAGSIAFENRSANAFEAVAQYGVFKVVDCLNQVLSYITGESFGFIDGSMDMTPDSAEFAAHRRAIIAGWRGYLVRKHASPPAPGKSLPLAKPPQSRGG